MPLRRHMHVSLCESTSACAPPCAYTAMHVRRHARTLPCMCTAMRMRRCVHPPPCASASACACTAMRVRRDAHALPCMCIAMRMRRVFGAPAAVPSRLAKIHWLVDFAVMSAMLLSLAKLRLNTDRVEPLAIHARPCAPCGMPDGDQGSGLGHGWLEECPHVRQADRLHREASCALAPRGKLHARIRRRGARSHH
eukprot:229770-Chlamydomonas_euryale.AAC.1